MFATGSEINPSFVAAERLEKDGYSVRLISVPSWELFDRQAEDYKDSILFGEADVKVSVEAGVGLGWQKFVGQKGLIISQETYGASAPESVMAEHFGFTAEQIYIRIRHSVSMVNKQIAVQ
jgi:transketolase